jgi:hypothetical protein
MRYLAGFQQNTVHRNEKRDSNVVPSIVRIVEESVKTAMCF